MTMLRPIPRAKGPIYSFVPIERIRPRLVPKAAETTPPPPPAAQAKPAEEIDQRETAVIDIEDAAPLNKLLMIVAREFKISRGQLRSKTRAFAVARKVYCYVACKHLGKGYAPSGRVLGRDHSTVMYSVNEVVKAPHKFEPHLSNVLAKYPAKEPQL